MDAYNNINFTPELINTILDLPAGLPPPNVTPDFDNQATNARMLWIACGICTPIMILATTGKLWARLTSDKRTIRWSDGFLLCSLFGTLSWIILSLVAFDGKFFGRHIWEIKVRFIDKRNILFTILIQGFWPIWFLLIKLSIFAMYLEIFGVKRWLRLGCYIGIVGLTCIHVAVALYLAIACRPIGGQDEMAYRLGILSHRCLSITPVLILQAAVNIFGDLYLIILPLPAVWSLNMPTKKRIGVCAMFFTGLIGVTASACSLYYRVFLYGLTDVTWLGVIIWTTAVYEMTAGIVVCCMPSLAAFGRRFVRRSRATLHTKGQSLPLTTMPPSNSSKAPLVSFWSRSHLSLSHKNPTSTWISTIKGSTASGSSSRASSGSIDTVLDRDQAV